MDDDQKRAVVLAKTFLGYELNSKQDVYVNYLTPTILGCLLYVVHFACDTGVVYRHFRDGNNIWASLSLFFIYLPVILCYVLVISSVELWVEKEGCGLGNIKWFLLKTVEHLFFPFWSMWRYAERLFWSIEGVRSKTMEEREMALANAAAPRSIELYLFLQGYVQTVPQIFLNLHLLMRYTTDMDKQTGWSLVMNLAKMALTTSLYQRFKKQNIGGRYYPWFKPYKFDLTADETDAPLRRSQRRKRRVGIVYATRDTYERLIQEVEAPEVSSSQRSSCSSYLEPITPEPRETSIIDGPLRPIFNNYGEVDFPKRLYEIKALPEDDLAGKTVSFLWWFTFLIARMVAISTFALFYTTHTIWLLTSHFILAVALLLYDTKANEIRRTKAIFYVFVGLVYLFCLIEFKVKFTKVKFWYYGFFTLVFAENFAMSFTWWFANMEYLYNDWWFKYIFYLIIGCTVLSLSSLVFYVKINKPKSVVVGETVNERK